MVSGGIVGESFALLEIHDFLVARPSIGDEPGRWADKLEHYAQLRHRICSGGSEEQARVHDALEVELLAALLDEPGGARAALERARAICLLPYEDLRFSRKEVAELITEALTAEPPAQENDDAT